MTSLTSYCSLCPSIQALKIPVNDQLDVLRDLRRVIGVGRLHLPCNISVYRNAPHQSTKHFSSTVEWQRLFGFHRRMNRIIFHSPFSEMYVGLEPHTAPTTAVGDRPISLLRSLVASERTAWPRRAERRSERLSHLGLRVGSGLQVASKLAASLPSGVHRGLRLIRGHGAATRSPDTKSLTGVHVCDDILCFTAGLIRTMSVVPCRCIWKRSSDAPSG